MIARVRVLPKTLLAAVLSIPSTGCESAPLANQTAAGSGEAIAVELLDAHFVRVDGSRIPWEELVYRLRTVCRVAQNLEIEQGEPFVPPWIRIRVAEDADPASIPAGTFDRIAGRLREAGVRRIEIDP